MDGNGASGELLVAGGHHRVQYCYTELIFVLLLMGESRVLLNSEWQHVLLHEVKTELCNLKFDLVGLIFLMDVEKKQG